MLLLLDNLIAIAVSHKKHSILKITSLILFLLFNSAQAGLLDKPIVPNLNESKFQANDLYQALSAEIYNKLGEKEEAVDFYYELSVTNNDPTIAKRVTELATGTGQIAKALDGAKRWVILQPDSLESNQYLALLLLRNSHFKSAATQLNTIRLLVDKTSEQSSLKSSKDVKETFQFSESLMFIGAMLTSESHHDKAFTTFDLFIKTHYSKTKSHQLYNKQIKLITSQLAMKAKKYDVVVNNLELLTGLDAQNHVDAKVMLAKALHKLQKNKLAIEHLSSIQNHPESLDSHRLELVRLLVLDKQKSTALPILEGLVNKHSKNFELLKSLIALQLDQSELTGVIEKIKRLSANESYVNESRYFAGEFAEKIGQQEKALLNFVKVEGGSYLKNAHKKTINLTKIIEGQEGLNTFFDIQQKSATSIKDQAYWIKLQADDLFESRQNVAALNLYNKAVMLAPKKSRYRYKRGLVNKRIGNLEKAEADFNHVLSVRENDVDALNALGYLLSAHTERLVEAKTYIDKAYSLKPHDPLVLENLGFVLYKKGELSKAEKYLREAFGIMKKPQIASHLITVLAKLNQHKEAKSIYLQMKKIYPNSPSLKSASRHLH